MRYVTCARISDAIQINDLCLGSQVRFNSEQPRTGFLKEWSLVLHGTKEAPYRTLAPTSPHSKLAIVKKAHEDRKM